MFWTIISSILLSLYDLAKKSGVRNNSVFPTLLIATLSGFCCLTLYATLTGTLFPILQIPTFQIFALLIKSLIVGSSWICAYIALRTLPITSVTPIRSTSPLWTVIGAIFIFREAPSNMQYLGISIVVIGFLLFSYSVTFDGIKIWKSHPLQLTLLGAILGASSSLFDKYLVQSLHIPTLTMLWWYMFGMCILYTICLLVTHKNAPKFDFRITIPIIGILLVLSDAAYFTAINMPDAKISVISVARRSSVILTFLLGGAIFKETNLTRKLIALIAILSGVIILCLK